VLLRSLPVLVFGIAWCIFQYNLTGLEIGLIVLAAAAYMTSLLVGSVLQSREKFSLAAWAIGGHRLIMAAIIAAMAFITSDLTLASCQIAVCLGFLVTMGFALAFGFLSAPTGEKAIPKTYNKDSYFFLATTVSMIVYSYTDRMIIPAVLGEESLAKYFAIYNPFMIFDMAAMALGSVLIVKVARSSTPVSVYLIRLGVLAVGGYLICLLTFDPLIHLLYKGRYDDARYLIPLIGITKSLSIILAVPTSLLGGRLGGKALAFFAKTNAMLVPLNVLLIWWLAKTHTLTGVAVGMLIICIQWNVVSFTAVYIFSNTRICPEKDMLKWGGNNP